MKHYPLLFTFHDKIEGNGFLADVETRGRALAVAENDGTWSLYGVEPGAIAGSGETLAEAHADFRRTFSSVLFDFVSDAKDFDAFDQRVQHFFGESDPASIGEWKAAVAQVRAGKIHPKELRVTEAGIRTEPADSERYVRVTYKTKLRATDNALDPPYLAVAA